MCNGVSTCRLSALFFHFSVQQCIRYVSEVYRDVSSMYLFQLVIFYNSILHQTECHSVSTFGVSCSFRFNFQGSCFILFRYRVTIKDRSCNGDKISQYYYTHENVFLCSHLRAHLFKYQSFCFLAFTKQFSGVQFVSSCLADDCLRCISNRRRSLPGRSWCVLQPFTHFRFIKSFPICGTIDTR